MWTPRPLTAWSRTRRRAAAEDAHRRSVVLAKNHGGVLPLSVEALSGKRVYVELFATDLTVKRLDALRRQLAQAHPGIDFTTDHRDADVAILLLRPFIGSYFEYVGIGDLSIGEHSHIDIEKVREIRDSVDTLVIGLNALFPGCWMRSNRSPTPSWSVSETDYPVMVEAMLGEFAPTGKLPLTFPIDAAAIAVDDNGRCASPNDVPGFAKEKHMGGRPYVYVDSDGNRYQLGHGLTYGG